MFLGVDVGTTSVKAGLFDATGRQLDSYNATYPTHRSPGGIVEQDPDIWVEHIDRALSQFAAARDLSGLVAIGITSQVNTHVFVDGAGNPLMPAIVWQDGRARAQSIALDNQVSDDDKMRWWGAPMPIDASHCLARMKWVAEHHPDIWARTRHVLLPKDYCILKLTGEIVSDPISNIGMIDLKLQFIPELLDLVPGAVDKMPGLAGMTDVAGLVKKGRPCADVPVATATMDAWASMFGVGVHAPGQGFYLSGTSEVLGVVSETVVPTPGILVFPKLGEMRVHAGPTQSGGASILWFCELFNISPDEMANLVRGLDPNSSCPLFLPHLQGERAPIWDIDARGTLLGMDASTGQAEIARAVYEGVGFSARWLKETLESSAGAKVSEFNCGGGGFQSGVWNQIRADILGLPLKRSSVKDPGVLGAAGMAAAAGGAFPDLHTALSAFVSFDVTYEPDPNTRARYDDVFQLYKDSYQATKAISHQLIKH